MTRLPARQSAPAVRHLFCDSFSVWGGVRWGVRAQTRASDF